MTPTIMIHRMLHKSKVINFVDYFVLQNVTPLRVKEDKGVEGVLTPGVQAVQGLEEAKAESNKERLPPRTFMFE